MISNNFTVLIVPEIGNQFKKKKSLAILYIHLMNFKLWQNNRTAIQFSLHAEIDRMLIYKSKVYLYLGGGVGGSTVVGASVPATDSQITPNLSSQL